MADTIMVFRVTQKICQKPKPFPGKSGPFSGPSRELSPSDLTKLHKTSGLDHLRESLQAEAITTLTTNSRRTSWLKHYEPAWDKGLAGAKENMSPLMWYK